MGYSRNLGNYAKFVFAAKLGDKSRTLDLVLQQKV